MLSSSCHSHFSTICRLAWRSSANCRDHDPNFREVCMKESNVLDVDDGFDRQVSALPRSITCRFGEVVFAQGGSGYGWWPCQIYDPRQAMDPTARQMAQKYLHSRFLVYFFNCGKDDAVGSSSVARAGSNLYATGGSNNENGVNPFAVLPAKMIKTWLVGMSEELYIGRAAKAHGKQRHRDFCDALQMAFIEIDKPKRQDQQQITGKQESIGFPGSVALHDVQQLVHQEPFMSPSPIKRQQSQANRSKKRNRPQESELETDIQWFHITIPNLGHSEHVSSAPSSLFKDDEIHPAFKCFAMMSRVDAKITESDISPRHKDRVVFSYPLSPLLAQHDEAESTKTRTQLMSSGVSELNRRNQKPEVPFEVTEPVSRSDRRQHKMKSLDLEEEPAQPIQSKRTRGRPKKNEIKSM